MASTIKIKRSSTSGNAPTTSDISAGELALNTADKIMYSSDGSTVFEIGSNLTTQTVGNLTVNTGFIFDGITFTAAQTSAEAFVDNDTSLMTSAAIADKIESYGYGTGGGAALELYAENPSTPTAPSATGANAVAIGSNSSASGSNSFAAGVNVTASAIGAFALGRNTTASGADSFAFGSSSVASGGNAIALGTNTDATQNSSIAIGNGAQATSSYSFAVGRNSGGGSAVATGGAAATALGGSYASGADSFAAAIADNTATYGATGANSVAIGDRVKATGNYSSGIGRLNTVSGPNGAGAIGQSLTVSGEGAFAAGQTCFASGSYSQALGNGASTQSIYGKFAKSSGYFNNFADMQTGIMVVVAATTDATPKVLTSNKGAASTTNQVILPNNSAYFFSGTIIARQSAATGTDVGAWEIKGAIRREANAASTVLVKSTIDDFNVPTGWVVALTADTTNGGLAITVTGAAATNIRWVATINTSEVTY
jgi:trimeric autotransporter adhesin